MVSSLIAMGEPFSSSKVTVEYFDPHGVYPLLSPGLLPRLPLRHLHWESHAGPLRSISTLHIDLVPSDQDVRPQSSAGAASASMPALSRVRSEDSAASGDDGFRTQTIGQAPAERPGSKSGPQKLVGKERRHQIPGLRQTHYLKVFLLRCDDNDTYKTQARKQVREWIKEHTLPTSKANSQENHDAFEWLVIHVVVPNTAAATQPRTSGKGSEGGSGSSTDKTTARWRGGGSSTILEKLRADFNGSSKSALDRIAQIRIGVNDVPYEMLPRVVPAIPVSYTETPQENESAWQDLISKLKSLILASFDLRVSQYEEDLREKDAQRSLPGWNFCTFFVLKEGLARGFESVGLVEDALMGYDELAVGLDAVIREQSTLGPQHGGSFLPFTEELKRQAETARIALLRDYGLELDTAEPDAPINLQSDGDFSEQEVDEIPLNASKKGYRELILANNISVFDFRCYLFARQLSLLLRMGNVSSSQDELLAKLREQRESSLRGVAARLPPTRPSEDAENLAVLAEICRRSIEFVISISAIMRDDIQASCLQDSLRDAEKLDSSPTTDHVTKSIIENMVSSFVFSITEQVLAQTSTKALPIPPSTLAPPSSKMVLDGQEPKAAIPEPKTMMHPARSSSLALRISSREPPSPDVFPSARRNSVPEHGSPSTTFLKAGLEDLAARRAEVYLFSRNILERAGKERDWKVGWTDKLLLQSSDSGDMEDVPLDEDNQETPMTDRSMQKLEPSLHGINSKLLRTALDNAEDFYRLYETLTDKALRHFTVANHVQSVQACMADLAVLKYHLEDYAAAASYFYRMTPFYGDSGWTQIELSMLVMYAECLEQLQRKEEYVRVVLKLLSKVAMVEKQKLLRKSTFKFGKVKDVTPDDLAPTEMYFEELLRITTTLPNEVRVPLQSFFGSIEVDGTPRYHQEEDSFALQLRFWYLLPEPLRVERVKVRMSPISGDSRDVWLVNEGPLGFKDGSVQISVESKAIIPGKYLVNHIDLVTNNMVLYYEDGASQISAHNDREPFFKCPKLLIYQRAEALDLKLFASRNMHLDRNRSMEIEVSSGWNDITHAELHVRAATAGLRLQISEAKVIYGLLEQYKKPEGGMLHLGVMPHNATAKLRIPFNLEHEVSDITIRLEISYTTEKGHFFFSTTPSVSVMLPLGVNVQDVFKHKALFSKFTISSSTVSPIRLLHAKLEDSEVFKAHCGLTQARPIVIFPRQPATMLYKITPKSPVARRHSKSSRRNDKASLSLVLQYTCLEEEIENSARQNLLRYLEEEDFHHYTRLVVPIVIAELKERFSPYDLEKTAVLGEISTSLLSEVRWRDHFSGLGRTPEQSKDIATLLAEKLNAWQKKTASIPLSDVFATEPVFPGIRSIVIPVDVPSVTVVHTADLRLLEVSSASSTTAVAVVNETIAASLIIKWTRIWDTQPSVDSTSSDDQSDMEFFYEFTGATDTWLIGGRRKGHFTVPYATQGDQSTKELSFPVILIPIREGYLPVPNVDVKPVVVRSGTDDNGDPGRGSDQRNVTCEVDYKNSAETIRVVSDARKTTVSLDASGPQGGAWLLESERRSVGMGLS